MIVERMQTEKGWEDMKNSRAHGIMGDEDLDAVIYGRKIIEAP